MHEHDRLLGTTDDETSEGLHGKLRIGLSPVCMAITSLLTAPFAESHPGVTVSALCSTMPEIERALKAFELDVGVTYLDGITQSGLRPYVLYDEAYYLLVPDDHYLSKQDAVSWREVGELPLCLLSQNLHNRIIIDRVFAEVGATPKAVIETNCSLGLFAHMRSGRWLTIVPHSYFYLLGDWLFIRAIPIVDPSVTNTIGLVIHEREPIAPVIRAFVEVAQRAEIGKQLDRYRR